ncbi:DUF4145 domain-containing protein [Pseudomonas fluorescens]|uniref:DUF4145 domain-containing protein n=1 Tax=Pseudomonas fluorescens TaxID=294 RepID=A0A5E7RJM6_PSEFL|nr:DUF4145 domain-containing protein [Pseudomonas fluorescens]VVP73507.1 hypothetical protein PS922_01081 [Pseudomonas fluorescens]
MSKLQLDNGRAVEISVYPDHCPICNVGVNPNFITAMVCSREEDIDALFVCPKNNCRRMFIASYKHSFQTSTYYLRSVLPCSPKAVSVVQEVADISPQYAEIFSQAIQAEAYGLGEVAGVGLRKSLEYLIKDYCTLQHPDKEDDIKKRPITQVIESFVTNENIKQCAKRAIWLGNDETHYVRKWVEKDINDLKLLLQITVNWIQQEVITKKLLEEMQ